MVNLRVGQTIRVYTTVWDFCGELGNNAIYISDVGIDTIPSLDPIVTCQDISGLSIEFRLVTSGDILCKGCNPEVVYSTWGTAYTNGQGLAYIDHVVTDSDLAAYQAATSSGNYVKVLACITGAKGQQVLSHKCSASLTVLTSAAPTHYIEFGMLENASGILETIKSYATMLTATINSFIPVESGWTVFQTEVDTSRGTLRLALSQTGSWGILEIAELLFSIIITAIGAILLIIFFPVGLLGIAIIVSAAVVLNYVVYRIIDNNVELQQKVNNLQAKDQNDTKLDQVRAAVFEEYEKSAKTKDDCLNLLNGLRISTSEYMDTMQKNFPNLYTPSIKRTYQATVDTAIQQLREDKITCARAMEIESGAHAISKGDVSTNFTANYNTTLGYTPPKLDCWITAPSGDSCILSANTGKWIVGSALALTVLGITYWAVTRKPTETKIVIEGAKQVAAKGAQIAKTEYDRMKAAYTQIRAPQVPGYVPRVPVTAQPAVR